MPADEIDYKLIGDDLQGVIVTLDPGLWDKLKSAGKRVLSGDSFFVTFFMNETTVRRDVAFASPFPGKIQPIDLKTWGGDLIAQKDSFLCGARGVDVTLAFSRRVGAGFFGGEGFILQRLIGDGLVFLHASGTLHEMTLGAGEKLKFDTGCLVAMQPSVDYDIQMVPGVKTALFGGEGLFLVQLTGPGRVILQTLPFSRLADRIIAAPPAAGGRRREEGSVLGALGGILDGDRR